MEEGALLHKNLLSESRRIASGTMFGSGDACTVAVLVNVLVRSKPFHRYADVRCIVDELCEIAELFPEEDQSPTKILLLKSASIVWTRYIQYLLKGVPIGRKYMFVTRRGVTEDALMKNNYTVFKGMFTFTNREGVGISIPALEIENVF